VNDLAPKIHTVMSLRFWFWWPNCKIKGNWNSLWQRTPGSEFLMCIRDLRLA
jgi:hypothetical protein